MRPWRSIGVRLALWYTAVLAIGLLLFGISVWGLLRYSLNRDVERSLAARLASAEEFLHAEWRAPDFEDEWEEYARALPSETLLEIRDPQGKRVASHPAGLPLTFLDSGERDSLFTWKGQDYQVRSARLTAAGQTFLVRAGESRALAEELSRRLLWLLAAVFFPLLALAGGGGYLLSRQALSPVAELTRQAESLSVDDLSLRLAVKPTGDELQQLAETWNRMLERLERAIGRLTQFTADASHELRTPVALIRTSAELALRRERPADAYRAALQTIQAEAERTTQLVDDLLSLARADAGRGTLPVAVLDVSSLVRNVAEQQTVTAQVRSIRLRQDGPAAALLIQGNAAALHRLVLILLDNALKYTPPGGTVTVAVMGDSKTVSLQVSDNGVGMTAEVLPHIFERFYRADPARQEKGGHGLGLSIAQWIAQSHGTSIEVESAPGQGSRFRVSFPAAVDAAVERRARSTSAGATDSSTATAVTGEESQ